MMSMIAFLTSSNLRSPSHPEGSETVKLRGRGEVTLGKSQKSIRKPVQQRAQLQEAPGRHKYVVGGQAEGAVLRHPLIATTPIRESSSAVIRQSGFQRLFFPPLV